MINETECLNIIKGRLDIIKNEELLIYSVTWNMHGAQPSKEEVDNLLGDRTKPYHIYAIGTQECMRSILASFFYDNQDEWIKILQYNRLI